MIKDPPKQLPPAHRVILDWLCRQVAIVHDFADIADSLKMKRGEVENVIADLKHQRFGSLLKLSGPDGMKLRARHAFLPHDSVARKGYLPVPAVEVSAAEHPTIIAMRKAQADAKELALKEATERLERVMERGEVHEQYRQRKLEAREKKESEVKERKEGRHRTGFAEAPLGPTLAPSSVAKPAPAATIASDFSIDEPAYKKKDKK